MGPEDRRGGRESADDEFEGRDLLVGRPPGAEARPGAGTEQSPSAAMSSQPGAHDEAIREILETARATAARIDALEAALGSDPESATAEALASETAALARERAAMAQSVEAARGTLAETAEIAARREKQAESEARVLTEGVAALKTQSEALDERIRATGWQAEATTRNVSETASKAEAVAKGVTQIKRTAEALEVSLSDHAQSVSRSTEGLRWRPWLMGLAIGSASFTFFVLGAVLQRETDVVSMGDPRHEWNEHVVENFAPTLAACAARARQLDQRVTCAMPLDPSRELTIPFYPDVTLTKKSPEEVPNLMLDP